MNFANPRTMRIVALPLIPLRIQLCPLYFVNETEAVDVKAVLTLKHVGGIRKEYTTGRDFRRYVIHEPVEYGERFMLFREVDDIAAHLRRAVGILALLALVENEATHGIPERLSDSVVIEKRLHDKECLLRSSGRERIHEFVVHDIHFAAVAARLHDEVRNRFER